MNYSVDWDGPGERDREGDGLLYDVAIWDHLGNVVKAFWSVTAEGVDKIREQYEDEPHLTVVVDEL